VPNGFPGNPSVLVAIGAVSYLQIRVPQNFMIQIKINDIRTHQTKKKVIERASQVENKRESRSTLSLHQASLSKYQPNSIRYLKSSQKTIGSDTPLYPYAHDTRKGPQSTAYNPSPPYSNPNTHHLRPS
jgi:hypothetical protein